jgi:hypothetical protein
MRIYRAFGMDILSEIELGLPERIAGTGHLSGGPTLAIARGEVALPPKLPFSLGRMRWACGPGFAALEAPWGARFRVDGASRVTVDAAAGADEEIVAAYILAFVILFVLHARGLLPLHGSAIRLGGSVAVLSGPSGSGKSTLAGFLCRAGGELLCDDLAALALGPIVLPGIPILRLPPDSFRLLITGASGIEPPPGDGKYRLAMDSLAGPSPLGALYVLRPEAADEVSIRPLTGMAKIGAIIPQVNSPSGLRTKAELFDLAVGMLGEAKVYELRRRRGLDGLAELTERVRSHFKEFA